MLGGVQEWLTYRSTAFGPSQGVWDGGPDFAALRTRWVADPALVEAMLVQGIAGRDPLAAESLRHLSLSPESAAGFCELLRGCVDDAPAGFRLAAASAAHELSPDDCWPQPLAAVLLGAGFWADRMEAARLIGQLAPSDSLIEALAAAVEDPEFLVRRQAAMALLRFGGEDDVVAPDDDVLALIRTGTAPAQWAQAGWQLGLLAAANAPSR